MLFRVRRRQPAQALIADELVVLDFQSRLLAELAEAPLRPLRVRPRRREFQRRSAARSSRGAWASCRGSAGPVTVWRTPTHACGSSVPNRDRRVRVRDCAAVGGGTGSHRRSRRHAGPPVRPASAEASMRPPLPVVAPAPPLPATWAPATCAAEQGRRPAAREPEAACRFRGGALPLPATGPPPLPAGAPPLPPPPGPEEEQATELAPAMSTKKRTSADRRLGSLRPFAPGRTRNTSVAERRRSS